MLKIFNINELRTKTTHKINTAAAATAKSRQSCPTLCNPIDSSPRGPPGPGNLQERTLEWVAISFSNAWKWKVKVKSLSRVRLLATSCTAAYQAPLSMGFSRQEYWSGVPLPSPIRKGRGTKDQIASIRWIIEKVREFQKKSTSASLTLLKPLTVWVKVTQSYPTLWDPMD